MDRAKRFWKALGNAHLTRGQTDLIQALLDDFELLRLGKEAAVEEAEHLKKENARIQKDLAKAHHELADPSVPKDVLIGRAVFKKEPGNGYREGAFCPKCGRLLEALEGGVAMCDGCWHYSLLGREKIVEIEFLLNDPMGD